VYVTNSLYRTWDDQFYPEGIRGWLARVDAGSDGGLTQSDFLVRFNEHRAHQVRLSGGDASSDSFCFG
jgi:selenium-binding protein 1